jgi:hypothetical protein
MSTSRRPDRKRIVTDASRYEPKERSYLTRAIEKKTQNKVSWDSLFKMNEATLHSGIVIPQFVNMDTKLDDIYY